MKSYSSDNVTREYVDNAVREAVTSGQRNVATQVSSLDEKQNQRIGNLERLLMLSFAVNLMAAVGAYFF